MDLNVAVAEASSATTSLLMGRPRSDVRSPVSKESSATMSLMDRALQEVLVSAETVAFQCVQIQKSVPGDKCVERQKSFPCDQCVRSQYSFPCDQCEKSFKYVQDEICQILFKGFDDRSFGSDAISSGKKPHDEDWYFKEFQKFFFTADPPKDDNFKAYLDSKTLLVSKLYCVAEFGSLLIKLLTSVWALHKLAFSFNPKATIFYVQPGQRFDPLLMEQVNPGENEREIAYLVLPGFQIGRNIFKARVYMKSSTGVCMDV